MEQKKYNGCITLDGRMDEPIWAEAPEYSDFKISSSGMLGTPATKNLTSFKYLVFDDRVFFGIKCMEEDMEWLTTQNPIPWGNSAGIEIFLGPSGNPYDFYQFFISAQNAHGNIYYEENGNIKPDPYGPFWNSAIYYGEDFWSVEVEFPLTAFYMTQHTRWSDAWIMNVTRTHRDRQGRSYGTTWVTKRLGNSFKCSDQFPHVPGFPMLPASEDVCISSLQVKIESQSATGYCGTMNVTVKTAVAQEYELFSDYSPATKVFLEAGTHEITVPCEFPKPNRYRMTVGLRRLSDGKEFKRKYPVKVRYEPIVLKLTKPEYRSNFYPGQDASQIIGRVTTAEPATLKLEGPGIPTTVIAPDADGNFTFETPNFEIGDAFLTITAGEHTLTQKIRHLAPTGRQMSWISDGHIVINGKPVLPRRVSAVGWRGGEAFKRKYEADDLFETRDVVMIGNFQPGRLIKSSENSGGEAQRDERPSEEMFKCVDAVLENCKDKDFTYYYICDEPECRGVSGIYLKYIYDYVTDKDPYHIVRLSTRASEDFVDIADWFETHPYINPYTNEKGERVYARKINTVGNFLDPILKLNRPDKCMGFLGTCFAAMAGQKDPYPTFEEMIAHVWAGIVRGGKSLCLYAYHDMNDRPTMYESARYLFSSIEALQELLLLGKRTVLVKNNDVEGALYEQAGEKLFVLVNMTGEPQEVTLDGISGTWHEFRHDRTFSGNTFKLKPLEVLIGTSAVMDEGIPTQAETAAMMEKLEAERVSGGSKLFERQSEIKVTSSSAVSWVRKIFDGVRDSWAWEDYGDKEEKFYELDLSRAKPSFSKVVISGWHIEDAKLKIRCGSDELIDAPVAEEKTEEFSKTFLLKEEICPDALRLEFSQRRVELYEIEAF